VVIFKESTPLSLIRILLPDVLVKGADYTAEKVVGRDVVEKSGGKVVLVPLAAKRSTTALINRIKSPKC
ncbi:MAG: bifunctional heptose 7-phosphate kinase/heptose 1-phosphate adenyltransferase, partial [bacterium (Candidatus Ratteibacteria) CG23_combo_of_CG06-09_8_20_14_all_48_7]